jgi:hypothetical protein
VRHDLVEGHKPGAGRTNQSTLAIDLVENGHS